MENLYGKHLAKVYDKMYQGFINYKDEFKFYSTICEDLGAKKILEIACGSGNLAKYFDLNYEEYLGLDFSTHMLDLARAKNPSLSFVQGDMRYIELSKKFDAALITGRSTSYLLTDSDLERTFASVYKLLQGPAIFTFDCIDANLFLPHIVENSEVVHEHYIEGIRFFRNTKWKKMDNKNRFHIDWDSTYFKEVKGENQLIGSDHCVFRVFEVQEIKQLLEKTNFKILEIIKRKTYAFDTFVMVAKKK